MEDEGEEDRRSMEDEGEVVKVAAPVCFVLRQIRVQYAWVRNN
jgi:hypothetical protein